MGRSTPCCDKVGLKKGPWTPEEDHMLISYIQLHGHGSCWRAFPAKAGLRRCGKSCRLRWLNYLRPDIKRGKFSIQEEQTTIQLHALLGNRWSTIAAHLPKRTDNEIKNYWNTHLKKRLTNMGIDPVTHKPKTNALGSAHSKAAANLSHVVQWENARLEAEARLVQESKPVASKPYHSQLGSSSAHLLNKAAATQLPPCLDVLKAWQSGWSKSTIHNPSAGANSFESPTSILNFSKNTYLAPTIASFDVNLVENIMKIDESLSQNEWESLEILQNNFPEAKQGIITVNPMESHENTLLSSFLEGVTDHLLYDTYDSPNFSMVMF